MVCGATAWERDTGRQRYLLFGLALTPPSCRNPGACRSQRQPPSIPCESRTSVDRLLPCGSSAKLTLQVPGVGIRLRNCLGAQPDQSARPVRPVACAGRRAPMLIRLTNLKAPPHNPAAWFGVAAKKRRPSRRLRRAHIPAVRYMAPPTRRRPKRQLPAGNIIALPGIGQALPVRHRRQGRRADPRGPRFSRGLRRASCWP